MDMNYVIRSKMDGMGVTIKDLSGEVHIGRVNLGYKLKGKREMTVTELCRISKALGLTAEDLEKGIL